jgi:prephenate dehydrogenase
MVEKVAVLGGTGKMGRWFARFFKAKGYRVVIGGRSRRRTEDHKELGVDQQNPIPMLFRCKYCCCLDILRDCSQTK